MKQARSAPATAFGSRIGTEADLLRATDTTKNRIRAPYPWQAAGQVLAVLYLLRRVTPLALGISM